MTYTAILCESKLGHVILGSLAPHAGYPTCSQSVTVAISWNGMEHLENSEQLATYTSSLHAVSKLYKLYITG